ncbi:MAG: hypothetical protein J6T52_09670 [Bacteroidaceae bacterium]|nr:hypothetical protein [Bacteroidaceae bacterium]
MDEFKNTDFLTCKSCYNQISKYADQCPHCGDKDPFCYKETIKVNKENSLWNGLKAGVFIFFIMALTNFFNATHYSTTTLIVAPILIIIVCLIISSFAIKRLKEKARNNMKEVFKHNGGLDELDRWEERLNEILNE